MEENKGKKKLFERIKDWCVDHQEEIAVVTGVTVALGTAITKSISKRNRDMLREERRMDNYIYDPATGIRWKTRRRNNNDNLIIAQRKANGEPLYKILSDMRLLK